MTAPADYADAINAIRQATQALDAHDRKEFYWSLVITLAETHPDALTDAVRRVVEPPR